MTEQSLPEESVFLHALDMESAADRQAYLDQACGDNEKLRADVQALLRAHVKSGDLLDLNESPNATLDQPITDKPGTRIGPYKLREQIGEGGFGTVYVAEQEQPVARKVALKIIKPGMDTKDVVARFEAERQALALMDHTNIAKVLDGGATESGRPYFVMELVRGVPITEYADNSQLTIHERLELFVSVCQAVQHAHQKGIIHRDIKPSNVMIAMQDEQPAPKVIDFGVAKAIGQKLTERTIYTRFDQMIGTPQYMSPEQAEMSALDIDTRSDIYSLGVLLYELLTGTPPLDSNSLRDVSFDEVRRMIREKESPRPSERFSTLRAEEQSTIAEFRRIEPKKLARSLRGDLDWIVVKALEKDRSRRYETASSLAADIDRFLSGEPVQACPPSAAYRLRKLARRNKVALTASAAVTTVLVLLLVTGMFGLAATNRRVTRERNVALENLYVAEVRQMQSDWERNNVARMKQVLQSHLENPLFDRGWEWHYLMSLCHKDERTLYGHASGVQAIAWSPDGNRLASGDKSGILKIWDMGTGNQILSLNADLGSVFDIAWSPDGQHLAAAYSDKIAVVWDAASGEQQLQLAGHVSSVLSIAWSPDGSRIATGSRHRQRVIIWDAETGKFVTSPPQPDSETKGDTASGLPFVRSMTWSDQGDRLAWMMDSSHATVWDVVNNQEYYSFYYDAWRPLSIAFSPGGRRLVAGAQTEFKFWDVDARQEGLETDSNHRGRITSVDWKPDGTQLATASLDNTVRIFDAQTQQELYLLRGHTSGVHAVDWSPGGHRLASAGGDGTVKIWIPHESQASRTLPGSTRAAWSHDNRRIVTSVGGYGGTVQILDVRTGQTLHELGDSNRTTCLAWSSDDGRIAGLSKTGPIRVWDTGTGKTLLEIGHKDGDARCAAWSPDDRLLASSGYEGSIKLWDAASGKLVARLEGHKLQVGTVVWSPAGGRLASASWDQSVIIWDVATRQQRFVFDRAGGRVDSNTNKGADRQFGLCWSPDGKRLVAGSGWQICRLRNRMP